MNKLTFVIALVLSCVSTITWAQNWQPPSPTARCPSKWGAADERGSGNHMTPYNCVKMDEVATRTGFSKMGMEKVGTLMTRGVLIDIAGLKGVDVLPINYEITAADLEQALQKQGISVEPGDAVLIYTGWSKHWGVDNKLYTSGCPGIGLGAAEWLIKRDPMLLGSDNWPVEIAPNPDKALSLPVHNLALTVNGVHLLENLVLEDLAKARVYEFAFVMQPLKLQGATGSTVAPTALR